MGTAVCLLIGNIERLKCVAFTSNALVLSVTEDVSHVCVTTQVLVSVVFMCGLLRPEHC